MANFARLRLCFAFCLVAVTLVSSLRMSRPTKAFGRRACWYKRCPLYARCRVINNRAVCVCPKNCSRQRKPVCGTNWRTYRNICDLKATVCSRNEKTRRRYNGECKAGDCRLTRWRYLRCPYYSKCSLNFGLPRCSCPEQRCSLEYKPVCGTDGRTYRNYCALKETACKKRKWLRIRNRGPCRPDPCRRKKCCCGGRCRVNLENKARCECPRFCTLQYDPVCGSDGKTYSNGCFLGSSACVQQNPNLRVVGRGPCLTKPSTPPPPPCRKLCAHYAKCNVVNGTEKCVCSGICTKELNPVCGSDGVTYPNQCVLEQTSCKKQKRIVVVMKGRCPELRKCTTSRAFCIVPCNPEKCAKIGQICCCPIGAACPQCTIPVMKSGRKVCPPDPLACKKDSDCSGGKICCPDGCTERCVARKG